MATLEPEEVLALRRQEEQLPHNFPMRRDLIRKLGSLSTAGQSVQITLAHHL